ncbi:MAG: hypothetical protein ACFFCW_47855 [Candidatus Hodarchaeota archaeon]
MLERKAYSWTYILVLLYVLLSIFIIPYYPSIYRDEPWVSAQAVQLFNTDPGAPPKLFNYQRDFSSPFRFIGFRALLAGAYSLFGYDFEAGRSVSLILGFTVLTLTYFLLNSIGINRLHSLLVIFGAGFTERFIWASHAIRPEIYVCVLFSVALLMMIRNSEKPHPGRLTDFFVGLICGLNVWVYDTALIIGFAFGLTYFAKFVFTKRLGSNRGEALIRFLAFSGGACIFASLWFFVNILSAPDALIASFNIGSKAHQHYLKGVPASLHFLARFRGFFYVPRSLIGYFFAPSWRPHIPELLVVLPALALSFRRARFGNMQQPEKDCLLLLAGMLLGFSIAGYMASYYWVLFLPPFVVIIAKSTDEIVNKFGYPPLATGVIFWVLLLIFAQLTFAPYPYHNQEYKLTMKRLRQIVESDNDTNNAVMGNILYNFAFPGRPFTYSRDFHTMNNHTDITLWDYCRRYNIGYVLVTGDGEWSLERWKWRSERFALLGSAKLISYTGSILRPGRRNHKVIHVLKFNDRDKNLILNKRKREDSPL